MPAQTKTLRSYQPDTVVKVNSWLTLRCPIHCDMLTSLHEAVGFAAKTPVLGRSRGRAGTRTAAQANCLGGLFLYHFKPMFYRIHDLPTERIRTIRPKEPILNVPATILYAVVILGLAHLFVSAAASRDVANWIIWDGAFIPARFSVLPFSFFYTLASYSLLHGGWGHLINNCVWLIAFGSPIAAALGGFRFTLFWITCAVAAALIHFAAAPTSTIPMIGASGAVSGMMGAVARAGFTLPVEANAGQSRHRLPPLGKVLSSRSVQAFILVYLLINIGIGFGEAAAPGLSGIAWQAHIGGLISGFFLISIFVRRR